MPFKQVFERRVNDAMQQSQAGPAPRSPTPSHSPSFEDHDDDIKKRPLSPRAKSLYEAEDLDLSSKDEKSLPPRFSTLFDTAKPPPTPRVVECCHRESKKRAGVYLSTPVFVLIIVALLFESTLLFAYTVIGLYQNLPSGLLAVTGAPGPAMGDGCRCEERQGAINFSPNFVFREKGGEILGQLSVVESMTAIESSPQPSPPTSTTPSPTTSSTTTTTAASTANAAAASHLLSLFSDLDVPPSTSPSPSISIVTATPGVVHSTIIVTSVTGIGGGGAETEAEARPTVTSVRIVDGPATTIQAG